MKLLRTLILFDVGNLASTPGWSMVHGSVSRSVASIDYPAGTGKLKLRRKLKRTNGQWDRNGVKYLKQRFLHHMVATEGWRSEGSPDPTSRKLSTSVLLYPEGTKHEEPVTSDFGDFDFVTSTADGLVVAIEWETGNISSSHRSLNKLAIALEAGSIQIAMMLVPSRALYKHLTDRIGNIGELSGYLRMWQTLAAGVNRGLLAIVVVEHDELTDDRRHAYLPSGMDGRSAEGSAKRK